MTAQNDSTFNLISWATYFQITTLVMKWWFPHWWFSFICTQHNKHAWGKISKMSFSVVHLRFTKVDPRQQHPPYWAAWCGYNRLPEHHTSPYKFSFTPFLDFMTGQGEMLSLKPSQPESFHQQVNIRLRRKTVRIHFNFLHDVVSFLATTAVLQVRHRKTER